MYVPCITVPNYIIIVLSIWAIRINDQILFEVTISYGNKMKIIKKIHQEILETTYKKTTKKGVGVRWTEFKGMMLKASKEACRKTKLERKF